jgi:biopolymer transport protein ExbD
MPRRHHYRRKKETPELELTTFLNLMVVLISFLLVTAVFSRITIQELRLPTAGGGSAVDKPLVIIEVILRKNGLEIGDGKRVVAAIPKSAGDYDIKRLSEHLLNLKAQYREKTDATLLVEAEISYQDVIRVMDAVKTARVHQSGQEKVETQELFPDVSVGDAP